MANKRNEPKTVPNYIGKMKSGALDKAVGYSIREGWTNPDNNKNMLKAGYFYANNNSKSNR